MQRILMALALALLVTGPSVAKVDSVSASGFKVSHTVTVPMAPQAAYERFLAIGTWWDKAHTFSGDASNVSIEAVPGGMVWQERLPKGGFVRHMTVASLSPGVSIVFRGGLGPMHFMGVEGAMTVSFKAQDKGTLVSLSYAVGGYDPDGFAKLSGAVDGVLAAQLARYGSIAAN